MKAHPLLPNSFTGTAKRIELGRGSSFSKSGQSLNDYIRSYLEEGYAYGGYLEDRDLYEKSEVFHSSEGVRHIHLGIDLWCPAGTPVHCPWPGEIHSFRDNYEFGDYGPTIILKHDVREYTGYSLYGHLSRKSLNGLKVGQEFRAGEILARLGEEGENVGWPPHLHFQLILDMEGKQGDYPGVCFKEELLKYVQNCPDPLQFLELLR